MTVPKVQVESPPGTLVPTAGLVRARSRVSAFSGGQIAVLFLLMLFLTSLPVWTNPIPPITDYINHLARMHVIATIDRDPDFSRFYQIEWRIIPNLMMDMVVPLIARAVSIYQAGQIFVVLTFALIVSGALALHRALFGRWSILPLVAFPLLYNYVFLIGLVNYLFGVGLALWGTAFWIALRERAWPLRLAVSTLFVTALFFCHFAALGVYGVGLLAAEALRLWNERRQPWMPRLAAFAATGLPFLLVLPLMSRSPTMKLALEFSWEPRGKIDGLTYIFEIYSDIAAFFLITLVVVGCVWAVRRNLLRVHPLFWVLLPVSGLVYLAMPRWMFATYMADQRLPIAFAFMLIACVNIDLRHRLVRRGFLAFLATVLLVRVVEVNVAWAGLAAQTSEFHASVKRIKRGSKVLVSYASANAGGEISQLGLVHAACIAMIERSALVTTAFTVEGKQILHVRKDYQAIVDTQDGTPPAIAQLILAADRPARDKEEYWKEWPTQYDYLYVLFTEDDAPNPDPDRLTLLQDGTNFQLYRIKPPK